MHMESMYVMGIFFVSELHSCIIFTSDHGPSLWWLTKLFKKSLKTCKKKNLLLAMPNREKNIYFEIHEKDLFGKICCSYVALCSFSLSLSPFYFLLHVNPRKIINYIGWNFYFIMIENSYASSIVLLFLG